MELRDVTIELFDDGVLRKLRGTLAVRRKLIEKYGDKVNDDLQSGLAIPDALWLLLHDENGNPPEGISGPEYLESRLPSGGVGLETLHAAIICALRQYPASTQKKMLENIETAHQTFQKLVEKSIGQKSSDSAPKSSDSPSESSGMDISNAKSEPESTPGANNGAVNGTTVPSTSEPSLRKSSTRAGGDRTPSNTATATFS